MNGISYNNDSGINGNAYPNAIAPACYVRALFNICFVFFFVFVLSFVN